MKNTQDLIEECVNKNEHVYVPSGKVEWRLPTGILTLDKVLGGGFPAKSVVQLYGPESSGKTTLAYRVVAQALNLGYSTLLIPIEPYSEEYAEMCGIDIYSDKFHIVAADFAEEVFNLCIEAIRNYDTMVIVMDSISMATPKADLEKKQKTSDLDKSYNIGSQARAISDFIRKIKQPIVRKQAIFVTVNQLSYQIGKWGGIKKPKGGEALQYASDIKLNMWGRVNRMTQDIQVNITVDKCKVWEGTPFGSVTLNLEHAKGFDIESDLIVACEKADIVQKKGSWYVYNDKKIQGLEKFAEILREDHGLKDELYEKATKANIEIEKGVPFDADDENGKTDQGDSSGEGDERDKS